ncbi:acyl-CoA dehydrogenase family protein [Saccharopolyspora sp. NPDC050642]|uniref:acyl-CoA dehydrogenase family protein n=1 Tax=Saccharopolyspora sp. NPDC050642 TaxID=3157099 RepID=UPI00340B5D11
MDSLQRLQAEVADWLDQHGAGGQRLEYAHEPYEHELSPAERDWIDVLRAGRWLCLSWPAEYGGRGLSAAECLVVEEEFARRGLRRPLLGMGETLLAPAVLAHGTEEQKRRFLPPILAGTDVYCQGFSEPGSGSDLASVRTTGVVEDDHLRIDGEKIWTSGAQQANMMFLLCRTDPDPEARHRGLTYAIVSMAGNGFDIRPIRQAAGAHGFAHEFITGARTPLDNVIGGLNRGWSVAMTTLGAERAGAAATQHFGYQREWEALAQRLRDTGRLDDLWVRQELARLHLGVQLMRASGRRIADKLVAGESVDELLAVDKLNWSEFHRDFGETALDLLGEQAAVRPAGPGYALDRFQRVFLESRGRRIARGTNQIQRNIIAERILGLPR